MGTDPNHGTGDNHMHNPAFTTLAQAHHALAIDAFDRFRNAAHGAGAPLAIINAFADYKAAVDFALEAAEASAAGNVAKAGELLGWSGHALAGMGRNWRC